MEKDVSDDEFIAAINRAKEAGVFPERLGISEDTYDAWSKGEKLPKGQFSRRSTVKTVDRVIAERKKRKR